MAVVCVNNAHQRMVFCSALPLRFVFAPRSRFAYPAVLQQVLRFVEQLHVDAEIRDVATETLDVL